MIIQKGTSAKEPPISYQRRVSKGRVWEKWAKRNEEFTYEHLSNPFINAHYGNLK